MLTRWSLKPVGISVKSSYGPAHPRPFDELEMDLLRPSRSAKGSLRPCAFCCAMSFGDVGKKRFSPDAEEFWESHGTWKVFAALVACFHGCYRWPVAKVRYFDVVVQHWGKDQRLSDISAFFDGFPIYFYILYIYMTLCYVLLTFNVTLRQICFEVACFFPSSPAVPHPWFWKKKESHRHFPRLKKWWSEANHWGTTIIKLWVCPLVCSQTLVPWKPWKGEWYDKYDKVKSLEVKTGGQNGCHIRWPMQAASWAQQIKFGVAGGQQLEEKKNRHRSTKMSEYKNTICQISISFEYFGSSGEVVWSKSEWISK